MTLEEHQAFAGTARGEDDLDSLLEAVDYDEDGLDDAVDFDTDGFDVDDD